MNDFITKYLSQFNIEAIVTAGLNKVLSLVLLFVAFYIIKKIAKSSVKRFWFLPKGIHSGNWSPEDHQSSGGKHPKLPTLLYPYLLYFEYPRFTGIQSSCRSWDCWGSCWAGAQGFLSDLVNGFFILIERQFDVGDVVKLTNGPITISGTIVSMGIRTTQVRDADGTLHFIPNRNILVVSNQSRGDMRAQIDIPLKFNTDLEQVYRVIEEVNLREISNFDQITGVTVLGPQNTTNGQFVFRVNLFVAHGQRK